MPYECWVHRECYQCFYTISSKIKHVRASSMVTPLSPQSALDIFSGNLAYLLHVSMFRSVCLLYERVLYMLMCISL